jgi:ubiquinone/menaquinone biosynthesis C-methylase UbiE
MDREVDISVSPLSLPQRITRRLMLLAPSQPDPTDLARWEVFNTRDYTEGTPEIRHDLQMRSAAFRYEYERQSNFFQHYFPSFDTAAFRDADVLDLGAFTGGRLVQWHETYGIGTSTGIDINPEFAEAGRRFAASRGLHDIRFYTGYGENLPYADNSFDFIFSYDVFEHVQDVEQVMKECLRVLRPGGRLFAVFPQFYQPLEAHLGLVTKMPALHWLFSGKTITRACHAIIEARGESAYWYARTNPQLEAWERLPTLNGITVRRFHRIIRSQPWQVDHWGHRPILTDGRRASKPAFKVLSLIFSIPARLPLLQELFLGRIAVILQKPTSD